MLWQWLVLVRIRQGSQRLKGRERSRRSKKEEIRKRQIENSQWLWVRHANSKGTTAGRLRQGLCGSGRTASQQLVASAKGFCHGYAMALSPHFGIPCVHTWRLNTQRNKSFYKKWTLDLELHSRYQRLHLVIKPSRNETTKKSTIQCYQKGAGINICINTYI